MVTLNNHQFLFDRLKCFSENKQLIKDIQEVANQSYSNSSGLLKRDTDYCDEIYLLRTVKGELAAFFMVKYVVIKGLPTYFLGWSCCRNDFKNFGLAKLLYNLFFIDCKAKENEVGRKIVCWWTTATPIAFHWFNKNIDCCEPDLNGNISNGGKAMFKVLTETSYLNSSFNESDPFILRGFSKNTNYNDTEKAKLKNAIERLNLKTFYKYPIDELNGDRYLMIGYAPQLDILKQRVDNTCP